MTTPSSAGATSGTTAGDLVDQITGDAATLLRQELRRAQDELAEKARLGARGAALLGGAGVLGAMAAGTSAALLLRTLGRVLPPGAAAFVATALCGGGAAALGAAGLAELRRAAPLVPEETVESLRQDVRAVRDPGPAAGAPPRG